MKKFPKFSFYILLAAISLLLTSWLVIRNILVAEVRDQADEIMASILKENPDATDDEKVIAMTRAVYDRIERQDPATITLYKLRPYLSNRRLPDFIRLPPGVMAALIGKGYCDNAARWLMFILGENGYKSVQWNMLSKNLAHSALLVTMPDGRKILADPFYGYLTIDKKGHLISPFTAQTFLKTGRKFDEVFLRLGDESDPKFYQNFTDMTMGAQGDALLIKSVLPSVKKQPLVLGTIDGDSIDVKNAGNANGLGNYWNYIGHQYSRRWVRVLEVKQPVRVVMTLVKPPGDGVLRTVGHPEISGKDLIWDLRAGQELVLIDGLARPSLRTFKSYTGVDRITFTYQPE